MDKDRLTKTASHNKSGLIEALLDVSVKAAPDTKKPISEQNQTDTLNAITQIVKLLTDTQVHARTEIIKAAQYELHARTKLSSNTTKAINSMIDIVHTAKLYGLLNHEQGISNVQLIQILAELYLKRSPNVRIDSIELTHVPLVLQGSLDFYRILTQNKATIAHYKLIFLSALYHDSAKNFLSVPTESGFTLLKTSTLNQSGQDIRVKKHQTVLEALEEHYIDPTQVPVFDFYEPCKNGYQVKKNHHCNQTGQSITVLPGESYGAALHRLGIKFYEAPLTQAAILVGVFVHHDGQAVYNASQRMQALGLLDQNETKKMWHCIRSHGFVSSWILEYSKKTFGIRSNVFDQTQYLPFIQTYRELYLQTHADQVFEDLAEHQINNLRDLFTQTFSLEEQALMLGDHQGQFDIAKYLHIHAAKKELAHLNAFQVIFGDALPNFMEDSVKGTLLTHELEQKLLSEYGVKSEGAAFAIEWLESDALDTALVQNPNYIDWKSKPENLERASVKNWLQTVPLRDTSNPSHPQRHPVFESVVKDIETGFYQAYQPNIEKGLPSKFSLPF